MEPNSMELANSNLANNHRSVINNYCNIICKEAYQKAILDIKRLQEIIAEQQKEIEAKPCSLVNYSEHFKHTIPKFVSTIAKHEPKKYLKKLDKIIELLQAG
jgi:hypothetical protein